MCTTTSFLDNRSNLGCLDTISMVVRMATDPDSIASPNRGLKSTSCATSRLTNCPIGSVTTRCLVYPSSSSNSLNSDKLGINQG